MADLRLRVLSSPSELRAAAPAWDRLWLASDCCLPTLQADLLAIEAEHFRPGKRFHFLAVEEDGRFVAALPIIDRGGPPGWRLGAATGNHWSPACDLLVDRSVNVDAALDQLAVGTAAGHWPLIDLHGTDMALERWQSWRRAIERTGAPAMLRQRLRVGTVKIQGPWSEYIESLSRNHRRQMRRIEKKSALLGELNLRVERDIEPHQIAPLVRRGFQVEHSSWKRGSESSVLSTEGMLDFYIAQAKALAARGQLQLTFLELNGEAIAFEYGWLAKGVYFAVKVGYDQARAEITPGQLLRWLLFERLHHEGRWHTIDFVGPLTRALSSWANDQYTISRLVVAPRRLSGRMALAAYRFARPLLARGRQSRASASPPRENRAEPSESNERTLADV